MNSVMLVQSVPELEEQLYRHEFLNRKGIKYNK